MKKFGTPRIEDVTVILNGKRLIDSRAMAAAFGLQHHNVVRAIERRIKKHPSLIGGEYLMQTHTARIPGKGDALYPHYVMNRYGFEAYAMKVKDEPAMKFRSALIEALSGEPINLPIMTKDWLTSGADGGRDDDRTEESAATAADAPGLADVQTDDADFGECAKFGLSETILDMPMPKVSIHTGEMMKVLRIIVEAHNHAVRVYNEIFAPDKKSESATAEALCDYIDKMTVNFLSKMIRSNLSERGCAAL